MPVRSELITSSANPIVKQIRKLLRDRKERDASGLFFVEGLRIVAEAVQLGTEIETLVVAPELLSSSFGQQLVADAVKSGCRMVETSAVVFKEFSIKDGPQGIGAILHQHWTALESVQVKENDIWVALDSVQDPGNLGTILRTLDAMGGEGLILLDQSTDPFGASAIRASMGAVFSQRLIRASLDEFEFWKKANGLSIIGTSDAADHDYHQVTYPAPVVLLMGSERQGLSGDLLSLCDRVVSIPMVGRSDSLNLAVATGIVLYEIFNQRRI